MPLGAAIRREVRKRAAGYCEYCGLPQDEFPFAQFHVEHVIAKQHGGTDSLDNLCLACHWCNLHKGPNIATLANGVLVPLYHPRRDEWHMHFTRMDDRIIGKTAIGTGTVALLNMNDEDRRRIRNPV